MGGWVGGSVGGSVGGAFKKAEILQQTSNTYRVPNQRRH